MSLLNYLSLALAAFVSATLIPASSEVVLAALLATGSNAMLCWLIATIANTLGSCVNWGIGRYLRHYQGARWFPVSPLRLDQAERLFNRYGIPSLLLAWLPVIGDAITVAAGLLRVRFVTFFMLVLVGKAARYAVIVFIVGQVSASR